MKWRGQEIGQLINISTDMWFLEGTFISNKTAQSIEFQRIASNLDLKIVHADPTKGTRILFGKNFESHALVLALSDNGILQLKQVFRKEAKEWLLENVI